MHIFFSGIGGVGIGSLALVAKQAGFDVSGSDKQRSQYIEVLNRQGITDIHIGQSQESIAAVHAKKPIEWYAYSSAVEKENPDHPEFVFVRDRGIKMSKRDEFINHILKEKNLKLVAIAGTHGKTTTTAMVVWLLQQLGLPVSYLVGAPFGDNDMGHYQKDSEYFVYECDEFDRNFLSFHPYLSLIAGVSWDHHEIYPTLEEYKQAFRDFIKQSKWSILWQREMVYLKLKPGDNILALDNTDKLIDDLKLVGRYNRENAWLAIQGVEELTKEQPEKLKAIINRFPSLHRRMEEIAPGLYSDEAHTPDKIRGAMSAALEMARAKAKQLVVVYEPLTNRRQHYMLDEYKDCFAGAKRVYWLPSYLAREDPAQHVIPPEELISHLADPSIAEPRQRDENLKKTIQKHLAEGDMVVCMAGGGGGSLDEWVRKEFGENHPS